MSDVGLFATQLKEATNKARDFDKALKLLKNNIDAKNGISISDEETSARQVLQQYLSDLLITINGESIANEILFRDATISSLKRLHSSNWKKYTEELSSIEENISNTDWFPEPRHIIYLEEIANTLEYECSTIFRRMQGRFR